MTTQQVEALRPTLRGICAHAWRGLTIIALLFATLALLWPTTETLLARWTDSVNRAYTHGALILALTCFMLWRKRAQIAAVPARHSWLAFALTSALGLAWLFVFRSGVQVGHQALLPLIWCGTVWTVFGAAMLRRVWLPIAYLYFAVPVWDAFVPLLQWASAYAVRGMLSVVGIPVFFDGLEFQIPAGRFEISGGCSGLHFFVVGLAVATFYGELHGDRFATRVKLLLLATFFALFTNWLRIAIIILAGHLTQMQHYLVSGEHYSFGWGMFAVAMAVYFFIVRRWPAESRQAEMTDAVPARMSLPLPGIALALLSLLLPALWLRLDANVATVAQAQAHELPQSVPGWIASEPGLTPAAPKFVNVDREQSRRFAAADAAVDAFSAVYLQQLQGKELGNYGNRVLGVDLRGREMARTDGGWLEIQAQDHSGERWLHWIRYRVGDAPATDTGRAQIAYGLASLLGNPVSSALVLRSRCLEDCVKARETLGRFVSAAHLASKT